MTDTLYEAYYFVGMSITAYSRILEVKGRFDIGLGQLTGVKVVFFLRFIINNLNNLGKQPVLWKELIIFRRGLVSIVFYSKVYHICIITFH